MKETAPQIRKNITILAPSFALMSITAVSPALASIAKAFPDTGGSAVQMLCTIPSLVGFPLILLSGKLASIFTKKQILTVSLAFMLLGGLMPVLFHGSYMALAAAAVVYGVGFGGISPMTTALISEHHSAEKQAGMMGLQSATIGLGGVFFSFLGGILAEIQWYYAYLAFLLMVPVLGLTLLLPKGVITAKGKRGERLITPGLLYYLFHALLLNCFIGVFQTNISMLISEGGLGGADTTGAVTAFYSFASIAGGLITGPLMVRLGRRMLPVITITCSLGMMAIGLGKSIGLVLLGTFLLGAMYAMRMPAGYTEAIRTALDGSATMAISLYCCCAQFGNFLSPLTVNAISTGKTAAVNFLTAGAILFLLALCAFGKESFVRRRKEASC